jgi:hypothetical protein
MPYTLEESCEIVLGLVSAAETNPGLNASPRDLPGFYPAVYPLPPAYFSNPRRGAWNGC